MGYASLRSAYIGASNVQRLILLLVKSISWTCARSPEGRLSLIFRAEPQFGRSFGLDIEDRSWAWGQTEGINQGMRLSPLQCLPQMNNVGRDTMCVLLHSPIPRHRLKTSQMRVGACPSTTNSCRATPLETVSRPLCTIA